MERGRSPSPSRHRGRERSRSRSRSRSPARLSKRERHELRERRRWEKEQARQRKEEMKRNETPEQKRARRLAKKAAKAAKREGKKPAAKAPIDVRSGLGAPDEFAGYTNNDNPFGDTNLGEKFTWHKKVDVALKSGVSIAEQKKRSKELARENKIELEKVKKARAERELEMEEREKEKEMEQRAKEDELHRKWMEQEEDFHLEQARMRSSIRVRDGRAKPIDILANYINVGDDDAQTDMHMHEPYAIFKGLTLPDLEDLDEDIKVYEQMEESRHPEFWEDMKIVCGYEMRMKQREERLRDKSLNPAQRRALESGINPAVERVIQDKLRGVNIAQLELMEQDAKKRLADGRDYAYWERLGLEIHVHIAKARLRARHQMILEGKLKRLREKSAAQGEGGAAAGDASGSDDEVIFDEDDLLAIEEEDDDDNGGAAAAAACPELPLIPDGADEGEDFDETELVLDPADDAARLLAARQKVLFGKSKRRKPKLVDGDEAGNRFVQQQSKGADGNAFDDQVKTATSKLHLWRDKYRPRKPRYFNRVHTGFEWNKYNQTHYDSDTPPPKTVQGYKFNIFYPDLVDKQNTPDFTLTPVPDEPGFAILKFSAGAPYEDIAFKVVDKPWEYAHRRGYRSQFSHNVLQLWFHFRRERYRR